MEIFQAWVGSGKVGLEAVWRIVVRLKERGVDCGEIGWRGMDEFFKFFYSHLK